MEGGREDHYLLPRRRGRIYPLLQIKSRCPEQRKWEKVKSCGKPDFWILLGIAEDMLVGKQCGGLAMKANAKGRS